MSIASEISRLQSAKADIKTAIEAKGVTVPSNATLDTYDTYVSQISSGGNNDADWITRSITSVNIPSNIGTIGSYAFAYCAGLTNITIPSNITTIDRNVFYHTGLTSITLPNSVTSIGIDCFGYTPITEARLGQVTKIPNYLFEACESLANIYIPNTVTTWGNYIMDDGGINGGTTNVYCEDGITTIGGTWYKKQGDLKIYIPSSATNITTTNESSYSSGSGGFEFYLDIPTTSTYITSNPTALYYKGDLSSLLTKVTKPTASGSSSDLYIFGVNIPMYFWNSSTEEYEELSGTVTLPNTITNCPPGTVPKNGTYTAIVCPSSITSIDRYGLRYTPSSCTDLYLEANQVVALNHSSNCIWATSAHNLTVHVPSDLIESYKTATRWSTLYNNGYVTFVAI